MHWAETAEAGVVPLLLICQAGPEVSDSPVLAAGCGWVAEELSIAAAGIHLAASSCYHSAHLGSILVAHTGKVAVLGSWRGQLIAWK